MKLRIEFTDNGERDWWSGGVWVYSDEDWPFSISVEFDTWEEAIAACWFWTG